MEKIVLREMKLEEADEAGRVCKRAFNHVQVAQYGRMVSCRDEEKTCHALRELAARTKGYAVVARDTETGAVVGSNFLDQRDEAAAVGPVTVEPSLGVPGLGRALMEAVLAKGEKDGHKSIRLTQEACNLVSFSLYAKLGFEPKEQISYFMGRCVQDWPEPKLQLTIRPMTANDLASCAALHRRVVGVDRSVELNDCMSSDWAESYDTPMVAVDDNGDGAGRLVGYITSVTGMGHGVSECDEITARLHHAMTQRVSAERSDDDVVLRLIGRQHGALVRWALTQAGLRLQRQATLMVRGEYAEPHGGVYVPSVMY